MGWYTYSTLETDEEWQLTINFRKSKVKRATTVTRVLLYTGDVTTDGVTVYMLYHYPVQNSLFYPFGWQIAVLFMLLPIILTLIAIIIDIVRSTKRRHLTKILIVPALIVCSLGIPLYFIILDTIDSFKDVPTGRAELKSTQARLSEVLLESLPQAIIQAELILATARGGEPVHAWKILTFTISIISFCFTLATNTHLFETGPKNRLIFFGCGLVAVTSRVLASAYLFIPAAILIMISISVWVVKLVYRGRCCTCCNRNCAPLSDIHHHCNLQSILHVPISWIVTAYGNCYTNTGLMLSTATITWTVGKAIFFIVSPNYTREIFSIVASSFATLTLLINLCVLMYARDIGDAWLNKNHDGSAKLY